MSNKLVLTDNVENLLDNKGIFDDIRISFDVIPGIYVYIDSNIKNIISNTLLGILFSLIAGIMLQISTYELLPSSLVYGKKRYSYTYLFIGFILMLFILLFF